MRKLRTPEQFQNRPTRLLAGLVGFILAYALVTRAIDTGSLLQYTGVIVLVVLSVRLIIRGLLKK
jgi:hypothetical protein